MKIDSSGLASNAAKIAESSYQNKTGTDFQQVLKKVQEEKDDTKLREACREIEAIFIHQMLKQMRATVPQSSLIEESSAAKIYRDMLDEKYSQIMARSSNSLGLADLLYNQMKAQEDIKTENEE